MTYMIMSGARFTIFSRPNGYTIVDRRTLAKYRVTNPYDKRQIQEAMRGDFERELELMGYAA